MTARILMSRIPDTAATPISSLSLTDRRFPIIALSSVSSVRSFQVADRIAKEGCDEKTEFPRSNRRDRVRRSRF
jgi:hypothetical protein